jgi:hypothetical protein
MAMGAGGGVAMALEYGQHRFVSQRGDQALVRARVRKLQI